MSERLAEETDTYLRYEDAGPGWSSVRLEWKPGTPADNERVLAERADAALTANQAARVTNDAFLAIAAPTNAQNAAHLKTLTQQQNMILRECSALIKLVIRRLDDTTGT